MSSPRILRPRLVSLKMRLVIVAVDEHTKSDGNTSKSMRNNSNSFNYAIYFISNDPAFSSALPSAQTSSAVPVWFVCTRVTTLLSGIAKRTVMIQHTQNLVLISGATHFTDVMKDRFVSIEI